MVTADALIVERRQLSTKLKPGRRLLIVTPAKNEAAHIQRIIDSIVAQTLQPALWIIVNDTSSDATGRIADRAASRHSWIGVIHRTAERGRRGEIGAIEAFRVGLTMVDLSKYDYICKLDADLSVAPDYFERMIERFEKNPRLGTASGKLRSLAGHRRVPERIGDEFSLGGAKLYRRLCFEEIGGFVKETMWDGIDCHRCRMLGWEAMSFRDPKFAITHCRQTKSSRENTFHDRMRWGEGQYFIGTHPLSLWAASVRRMAERPWIVGGLGILWGYLRAAAFGAPRYEDPAFRKHLRSWQLNKLKRMLGLGGPS